MLKSVICLIKCRYDEYHCTWHEVPDTEKIASCQSEKQKLIDDAKDRINEATEKINDYEDKKKEIKGKIKEAEQLKNNFNETKSLITTARLDVNLTPCTNCIEDLVSTFNDMLNDCDDMIQQWTDKLTQAMEDLDTATAEYADCSLITKSVCD